MTTEGFIKYNGDGTMHTTAINKENNTRDSADTDKSGNIANAHTTDQNLPKGDLARHSTPSSFSSFDKIARLATNTEVKRVV